jgi:hypothetical protein
MARISRIREAVFNIASLDGLRPCRTGCAGTGLEDRRTCHEAKLNPVAPKGALVERLRNDVGRGGWGLFDLGWGMQKKEPFNH